MVSFDGSQDLRLILVASSRRGTGLPPFGERWFRAEAFVAFLTGAFSPNTIERTVVSRLSLHLLNERDAIY